MCYARVSSHDQSAQLQTQAARLERPCHEMEFSNVEVVTDLGSGLNYRKKGLQRVLRPRSAGRGVSTVARGHQASPSSKDNRSLHLAPGLNVQICTRLK
ncbi:recombinase family protein [Cupriavidus necator]